jgi:hypothetical protein
LSSFRFSKQFLEGVFSETQGSEGNKRAGTL